MRRHREDAVAQLFLKAVHHRDHDDQRRDAERDAGHRYRGDERHEAVAARAAARAKVAQADQEFVGDQQEPYGDCDAAPVAISRVAARTSAASRQRGRRMQPNGGSTATTSRVRGPTAVCLFTRIAQRCAITHLHASFTPSSVIIACNSRWSSPDCSTSPHRALAAIDAARPCSTRLLAAAAHRLRSSTTAASRSSARRSASPSSATGRSRHWLARAAGIDAGAATGCAQSRRLRGRSRRRAAGGRGPRPRAAETRSAAGDAQRALSQRRHALRRADPARWLVGCGAAQSLSTQPPERVHRQAAARATSPGADARTWRSWQNEIQMLLFEHPVNAAREAAGRAVVNSVWLWGGGTPASDRRARPDRRALRQRVAAARTRSRARRLGDARPAFARRAARQSTHSPALVWLEPPVGDRRLPQLARWLGDARRALGNAGARRVSLGTIKRTRYRADRPFGARRCVSAAAPVARAPTANLARGAAPVRAARAAPRSLHGD